MIEANQEEGVREMENVKGLYLTFELGLFESGFGGRIHIQDFMVKQWGYWVQFEKDILHL